ncbi:MAG TPA: hypothetical protein VES39_07090 [Rhodospirillales bacterium]|nr:hypothetical protein [Rhodospirillales bacterium]
MSGVEIALAATMIAATAASTGVAAHSAQQQKQAQKKAIKYQAEGESRALELRTEARQQQLRSLLATQRNAFAGSGIDPTAGSALSVAGGSAFNMATDIATDQEMTGRGLGGLEYQRNVLSYEQSLIPYQYGAEFLAKSAQIAGSAYMASAPVGDVDQVTGQPLTRAQISQEKLLGRVQPVPRPAVRTATVR